MFEKKRLEAIGNMLPWTDLVLSLILSSKVTVLLQFLTGCRRWSSIHFFLNLHTRQSIFPNTLYSTLHLFELQSVLSAYFYISREAFNSLTLLSVSLNTTFIVWGQNCSSMLFNALVANTRSIMCFDIKTKIPKAEENSYLSQKKKKERK